MAENLESRLVRLETKIDNGITERLNRIEKKVDNYAFTKIVMTIGMLLTMIFSALAFFGGR